jgi:hypothetical protein
MNIKMYKGLIFALTYYLIAILISYVVYLKYGWTYIHAPGLHHLTFIFFLLGGFIWNIYCVFKYFQNRQKFHKQLMLIHSLVFGGIITVFLIAYFQNNKHEPVNLMENDMKSISIINKQDTSICITEKGDTIFLKIRDSVLIDEITK